MKHLRQNFWRRLFTIMAGITFLNMSFILAEISMLGLDQKYNNLVQIVLNSGLEEEKEVGNETEGMSSSAKELDLIQENLIHYGALVTTLEHHTHNLSNMSVIPGFLNIFSPPPEA